MHRCTKHWSGRPHFEYCIQARRSYRKKDIYKLYMECGLIVLETRRLIEDQIEFVLILNGYEDIDRNVFLKLKKDNITRGHSIG